MAHDSQSRPVLKTKRPPDLEVGRPELTDIAVETVSIAQCEERAVFTEVNVEFRLVPMAPRMAITATLISMAIRPYSIAVAPDSSFTKRATRFVIFQLSQLGDCFGHYGLSPG